MGFNCVRFPWSVWMVQTEPAVPLELQDSLLGANPQLHGHSALEILDAAARMAAKTWENSHVGQPEVIAACVGSRVLPANHKMCWNRKNISSPVLIFIKASAQLLVLLDNHVSDGIAGGLFNLAFRSFRI